MPSYVEHDKHILLLGPGLDDLLDPERRIVLIDDYFSDVYSDYIFMGYDVLVMPVDPTKPDVIGGFQASALLHQRPSILVCGHRPDFCLLVYPSYLVLYKDYKYDEAIRETEALLSKVYNKDVVAPYQIVSAVKTLERIKNIYGFENMSTTFLVASNYDYGKNRFRYADRLSWLVEVEASPKWIGTAMLYFLIEGHGEMKDLYKLRVEALGRENLVKLVGEEPLEILKEIANGDTPKELKFIDTLEPGGEGIQYLKREGNVLKAKCLIPHVCTRAVEKAKEMLPLDFGGGKIEDVSASLQ